MKIKDYIEGQISAAELEGWLAPYERYVFQKPDSDLARAVGLVGLAMADMDNGQSDAATRAFLRRRLGKLLRAHTVTVIYKAYKYGFKTHRLHAVHSPRIASRSTSQLIWSPVPWTIQPSIARTEPQAAHV